MTSNCATCSAELEPRAATGRPATYCGTACRRLAEWRIGMLTKRLAAYETERREVMSNTGRHPIDEEDRRKRLRDLRRWMREDEAHLLEVFGREPTKETKA